MFVREAEALALREAIQVAFDLNMENVAFEIDSQTVVQVIHSNYKSGSEFYFIINSIKALLILNPSFKVKLIKRQANMVVHSLARAANSWPRCNLLNLAPSCIERFPINDKH
ncbi:unnamed protein product [Lathyrus sativus]|nr:unnamed protein product [Lathyrus sativus]